MPAMDPKPPLRWLHAVRRADPLPAWVLDTVSPTSRVSSVYGSVLDIAGPGGLLAVADDAVGGLPDGVSVVAGDLRRLGVRPGMQVTCTATRWAIPEARVLIELGAARPWSPILSVISAPDWPDRRGPVIARLAAVAGDTSLPGLSMSSAAAALADLGGAISRQDRGLAAATARRLIGWGAGLTPAGDDIVTGAEAALRAIAHPMAGFAGVVLADVESRTTEVAAAMLRHAAFGAFAERIHRLIEATLVDDLARTGDPLRGAADWGATSGTDTLAGIVLAIDAVTGVVADRCAA